MLFKTDGQKAAKEAAKARQDASEAGASAASGARNLSAAALASLAQVTAPHDDRKGQRHAKKARAKALKAVGKDRDALAKAAGKARGHGAKAAGHGRTVLKERGAEAGDTFSTYAEKGRARASEGAHRAAQAASGAASSAREQGSHAAEVLRDKGAPLGEAAAEKAGAGAAMMAALAVAARDKAAEGRDRAVAGVDHGIDVAVPRAQEGVAAMGPKVDHVRDVINKDLLPKLQEMLGEVQAGKDRARAKDGGAKAALTGTAKPPKKKKKGKVLIALGLLAAAGAGVAWWLSQQKAPATDPWASQSGADPWASQTPTTTATVTETETETVGTAPVAAGGAVTAVDEVVVEDVTTGPAAPTVESFGPATDVAEGPHLLESEEIDRLGAEQPIPVDEQGKGETPTEEIEAARAKERPSVGDTTDADVDPDQPRT